MQRSQLPADKHFINDHLITVETSSTITVYLGLVKVRIKMVYPTLNRQSQKSSSDSENGDKTSSMLFWMGGVNDTPPLPPIEQSTPTVKCDPGLTEVKVANGRKKRSGLCVGGSFVLGVLAGVTFVAMTALAISLLTEKEKGCWVEVDSKQEYHRHSLDDKQNKDEWGLCDLRGGQRPFQEDGTTFLEFMRLINDQVWEIHVPNYGHDATGKLTYNYTMVVDFPHEMVAFKTMDSQGLYQPECFLAHVSDLDIPTRDVVGAFLEDTDLHTIEMSVSTLQRLYFQAEPWDGNEAVGDEIEILCAGVPVFQLTSIVEEVIAAVEELLDTSAYSVTTDANELMDTIQHNADNLQEGQIQSLNEYFEPLMDLVAYIPTVLGDTSDPINPHQGMALSINIRSGEMTLLGLDMQLWPHLNN